MLPNEQSFSLTVDEIVRTFYHPPVSDQHIIAFAVHRNFSHHSVALQRLHSSLTPYQHVYLRGLGIAPRKTPLVFVLGFFRGLPLVAHVSHPAGCCCYTCKGFALECPWTDSESTLVGSVVDRTGCIGAGVGGRLEPGERPE